MKLSLLVATILALPISVAVAAEETKDVATKYACMQGKSKRTVEIVYEAQGKKVPCKVVYTKESETKDLWTSKAQPGYCEEKAAAFVEKLKGLGLDCKAEGVASPAEAPAAEATPAQ